MSARCAVVKTLAVALVWLASAPTEASTWRAGAAPPSAYRGRIGHAMAYDPARGRVVVFGGSWSPGYLLNDTWEYDGLRWVQGPAAPAGLTPRWDHAMSYHAGAGRVVLFGGSTGSPKSDTWLYDGSSWSSGPPPAPGLTPRGGHAMTYDELRDRIVLFGGDANADTWEFDGSQWMAGPSAPVGLAPRSFAALAYDSARDVTVLFGGDDGTFFLNDTWEYDGTQWTQGPSAPAGLTDRCCHAMAYDTGLARVVLFGGSVGTTGTSDTWEYDGVSWTAGAPPSPGQRPRSYHAVAFSQGLGAVILTGGLDPPDHLDDVWHYVHLDVLPPTLPAAVEGQPYSQLLTASGGTAPYTFVLAAGNLPAGLTLAPTGLLSGTPTTRGAYRFAVKATDAMGLAGSRPYDLIVRCSVVIVISPSVLPDGLVGSAYSQTLTATGGAAPYTFAVTSGSLPAGLNLSAGGVLSGTPTSAATSTFEVTATDQNGCFGVESYDLTVRCPGVSVDPPALPPAVRGASYLVDLQASGGTPPFSFTVDSGALPPGLTLSSSGRLSGSPTAEGTYSFAITATGALGCSGFRDYTMVVEDVYAILAGEGWGPNNPNRVRAFDAWGQATTTDFLAYAASGFGTNVAGGDVDADPYAEILTGPGPGGVYGPQVRGFKRDGTPMGKINFYAYGTLKFGAVAATGRLDADEHHEILSGAGPGAVFGPHVRGWNFDGVATAGITKINYFAYGTLRFGVNVRPGDLDADGFEELVTGPGPGVVFGPQVRGWSYDELPVTSLAKINFNAFGVTQYGARVAVGDVDLDGYGEIGSAQGPGVTSAFLTQFLGFDYDAAAIAALPGFDVQPYTTLYGGRLDLGGLVPAATDRRDVLVTGAGPDPTADSTVHAYSYTGTVLSPLSSSFLPFVEPFGVNVAAGALGL